MPAKRISLKNAKENKLFYFVANVVVYRKSDGRCLILKRSMNEKVHPGKYCVIGGKLEWQDLNIKKPTRLNGDVIDFENQLEKLLIREAKEEANIKIKKNFYYLNSIAFIRPDEIPVIMVKMAAELQSGKVKIQKHAFDDFAWVNDKDVKKFDCIEGIKKEIKRTVKIFEG